MVIFKTNAKLRIAASSFLKVTESGGLSLEAAIVLPLSMIFIFSLILITHLANYRQQWHSAGIGVCQELETLAAIVGNFEQGNINSKFLGKLGTKLPLNISKELINKRNGLLSAQYLLRRQAALFKKDNGNRGLNTALMSKFRAEVELKEDEHVLHYLSSFNMRIFYWSIKLESKLAVPLWNRYPLADIKTAADGKGDNDSKHTIWSETNFIRGDHFQEKYGADLPKQYPVISSFRNGVATSIKSIDLTNPNLKADGVLRARVSALAADLSNFNGYISKSEKWPSIYEQDIVGKRLLLIVPANSEETLIEEMRTILIGYSDITFEIVKDEESYRYVEAENGD